MSTPKQKIDDRIEQVRVQAESIEQIRRQAGTPPRGGEGGGDLPAPGQQFMVLQLQLQGPVDARVLTPVWDWVRAHE